MVLFVYCLWNNDARFGTKDVTEVGRWGLKNWEAHLLLCKSASRKHLEHHETPITTKELKLGKQELCVLAITCFIKSVGLCV